MLDDLQWADTATLDLLCHVARHQPEARLLVLGAYREGEVTRRPLFERALTELTRLRRLTTITLGTLTITEMATLTASVLGAPLDPAARALLSTQSEGNPFFAEELLWGWLETGVIARWGGTFGLVPSVDSTLPSSIVNAVRQRLARLSPEIIDLLHTAAIIGRTFNGALLAKVAAQEAEAVEEHLQEATHAHLIRADRSGMFTFDDVCKAQRQYAKSKKQRSMEASISNQPRKTGRALLSTTVKGGLSRHEPYTTKSDHYSKRSKKG